MASVDNAKTGGAPFANDSELIRVTYDFAGDGGATGDLTLFTASSACVVFLKAAVVKTAVTSGGSLTMDLGKGASGSEFWNDKAVAALTLNSLHVGAAPIYMAAADIINLQIDTAAATAGKIEFIFEIVKY